MYDFVFYFFYGILRRTDDDPIFTSILGVFLIIALHIIAFLSVLVHFNLFSFPRFSNTYLYNKLYWYIPGALVLVPIYLYFSKRKTKNILQKYSEKEDFYSAVNILFFLLLIIIPALAIAKL
jgi:uncharacterized membrane protein